jgi:CelD/BcsL family acetyltransferase involved in cellulose biosynthesis
VKRNIDPQPVANPIPQPENGLRIEIIRDSRSFEALRGEWNELLSCSAADSVFLTWEWLYSWFRTHPRGHALFLVTVRSGAKLVALAPFVYRRFDLRRPQPLPCLEFMGAGTVGSDYLDLIVRDGCESAAMELIIELLANQKRAFEFTNYRIGSSTAESLTRHLKQRGWAVDFGQRNICPHIDLSAHTWDSYLASLSNRHRSNLVRRTRILQEKFRFRFETIRSERDRGSSLGILVRLHNLRWKGKGHSEAFRASEILQFHEEFSRLALSCGWLRLFILYLDDVPAAALYGMVYQRKFYFYQSGFDPAFATYSVGLVLMGQVIQSAIAEGAREFDFLHGNESYKFLWANLQREIGSLSLYPPRLRGLLYRRSSVATRAARRKAGVLIRSIAGNWRPAQQTTGS